MKHVNRILGLRLWMAGVVLAHGFWSTLFAVLLPPWGWYLTREAALKMARWI